jgi:hypothetical protein
MPQAARKRPTGGEKAGAAAPAAPAAPAPASTVIDCTSDDDGVSVLGASQGIDDQEVIISSDDEGVERGSSNGSGGRAEGGRIGMRGYQGEGHNDGHQPFARVNVPHSRKGGETKRKKNVGAGYYSPLTLITRPCPKCDQPLSLKSTQVSLQVSMCLCVGSIFSLVTLPSILYRTSMAVRIAMASLWRIQEFAWVSCK